MYLLVFLGSTTNAGSHAEGAGIIQTGGSLRPTRDASGPRAECSRKVLSLTSVSSVASCSTRTGSSFVVAFRLLRLSPWEGATMIRSEERRVGRWSTCL